MLYRMFPVLFRKSVNRLVDLCHLLYFCRVVKKGVTGAVIRDKTCKDNPCLPVKNVWPVDFAESPLSMAP